MNFLFLAIVLFACRILIIINNYTHMINQKTFLDLGEIRLDFLGRQVFVNDDVVILRNKLFDLLVYFVKNGGRVISRTQLLEDVWDRNIMWPTNTLDVHVNALRRALRKPLGYDVIRTVHCIGYVFSQVRNY